MINVTRPYLPPLEEYNKLLQGIWERNWLTNNGPLVQELEEKLAAYLGVKHLIYVNNGTIALQIALKALEKKGEVITTPFSYVATTNCILWEGFIPVFADIKNTDYNIAPAKIEPLITEKTVAIMATHVYGLPCDVEAIEAIAKKHGLVVIYDGAQAFATKYKNKQLLSYGDIATVSFHATKIFHTVEGGAIICQDDELAKKMRLYRSFGHVGDEYFSIGINGKVSELHAAMGLTMLPLIDEFVADRKRIFKIYDEAFAGTEIIHPVPLPETEYNFHYYPIILPSEEKLKQVVKLLTENEIGSRRYFYPSLNQLPQYKGEPCPISESIAVRVLALPIYYKLEDENILRIAGLVKEALAK